MNKELEIPESRQTALPLVGVYFLFQGETLVYIGQSRDIHARIVQHRREKEFDSFSYLECREDEIDNMEIAYIKKYRPPYNQVCHVSLDPPLERHRDRLIYSPLSDEYWANRLNRPIEAIARYREENGRKAA